MPEAERSKLVALTVGLVGIVMFFGGCGSQAGEAPSDHSAGQRRTATNEEPSISKPPESTLSFGDRTVTGELAELPLGEASPPTMCSESRQQCAAALLVVTFARCACGSLHRPHSLL